MKMQNTYTSAAHNQIASAVIMANGSPFANPFQGITVDYSGITAAPLAMCSLEMSELTGKNHADVMRDIRNMLEDLGGEDASKFAGIYLDAYKREKPCYNLPRDLTETLITGYSAPLRHKVVVRLHELEAEVAKPAFKVPTTLHGALLLAAELEGQRAALTHQVEAQVQKITQDAPKVEFYDYVAVAVGTQSVQDVAKEFGFGSTTFYKLLREQKILMGHPNQNVPYQKHLNAGHFEVVVSEWKVEETGEVKLKPRPFVTSKGLIYLERRLNKLGYFRQVEEAA